MNHDDWGGSSGCEVGWERPMAMGWVHVWLLGLFVGWVRSSKSDVGDEASMRFGEMRG